MLFWTGESLRGPGTRMQHKTLNQTHFWLVRHGETEWNALRRLQGWRDTPLSETGQAQAEQLRAHLAGGFPHPPQVIYSSDLRRAYDTAVAAASHYGLPIHRDPALRERNYGIYEGQDWALLNGADATRPAVNFRQLHQPIENGESLAQFAERIQQAFERIARQHSGKNVMVFAHGGVIDIAWRLASQVPFDAPRPSPIHNTSINHFCIHGPGHWEAINWGQTGHLEQEARDDVI